MNVRALTWNDVLVPKGIWKKLTQQEKSLVTWAEAPDNSTPLDRTANAPKKVNIGVQAQRSLQYAWAVQLENKQEHKIMLHVPCCKPTVTKRNNKNNTNLLYGSAPPISSF